LLKNSSIFSSTLASIHFEPFGKVFELFIIYMNLFKSDWISPPKKKNSLHKNVESGKSKFTSSQKRVAIQRKKNSKSFQTFSDFLYRRITLNFLKGQN